MEEWNQLGQSHGILWQNHEVVLGTFIIIQKGDGAFSSVGLLTESRRFYWLFMDVVGENEALQQFFEGKSLVLKDSLNNFQWQ